MVCDNVYRESGGKQALVGLFNRITTPSLPAMHPRMCVYASVTDIRPGTILVLEIVHSETDEVVVRLEGPPPKPVDPTTICDLVFELNGLKFPRTGRYYIVLHGNNQLLLQRPFDVVQSDPGKPKEGTKKE